MVEGAWQYVQSREGKQKTKNVQSPQRTSFCKARFDNFKRTKRSKEIENTRGDYYNTHYKLVKETLQAGKRDSLFYQLVMCVVIVSTCIVVRILLH